jgi:hypothetical protein
LAIVSALIAIATFIFVRNPPKVESAQVGGFSDLLKMPVLWLIIPLVFVNYLARRCAARIMDWPIFG